MTPGACRSCFTFGCLREKNNTSAAIQLHSQLLLLYMTPGFADARNSCAQQVFYMPAGSLSVRPLTTSKVIKSHVNADHLQTCLDGSD